MVVKFEEEDSEEKGFVLGGGVTVALSEELDTHNTHYQCSHTRGEV